MFNRVYSWKTKNWTYYFYKHSGGWWNFKMIDVNTKDVRVVHFIIGSWELDCNKRGTRVEKLFEEWKSSQMRAG